MDENLTDLYKFNNNVAETIKLMKPIALDYYEYQNKVKDKAGVSRGVYG